jgi:hypothetical protein
MASYMRLPQNSAMIEPMTRKTFVASSSKAFVSLHKRPEDLDSSELSFCQCLILWTTHSRAVTFAREEQLPWCAKR